jgi:glyoxylase-like metal-dependent hydrolase (beta-lactamase superfamily II)
MRGGVPPLLFLAIVVAGCGRAIAPLRVAGASTVALTSGPNTSMIYLARTAEGVLAIDLGWWGHERALDAALRELNATRRDVRHVFLTHSHRDHIGAWRSVRYARFHLADAEFSRLLGDSAHRAWIPRIADKLNDPELPRPGELAITTFTRDTAFVVGRDTMRAYLVAGHTAGTAVYLFRGVLFLGDAVTFSRFGGFAPAKRGFSDDRKAAIENLQDLWNRLPPGGVRYACTAHARCAPYSPHFLADVAH